MYSLSNIQPFEYRDPWDIELNVRLRMLYKRDKRVAYLYEGRDNSTFRYRVFNMVDGLNSSDTCSISATWFYKDEIEHLMEAVPHCDAIIICRTRYSPQLVQLVRLANRHNVRIFFDVDDLVFNPAKLSTLMDTVDSYVENGNIDYWFSYASRHAELLKLCDGVILTNPFLAGQAREFAQNIPTYVIPNFLNGTQQKYSEEIFECKNALHFYSKDPIKIGYFSGSPSHRRDFAIAAPAIARMLKKYENLRLVLVGYIEPGQYLEEYRSRIDYHPMQDFVNLQRLIGSVDINVVPLLNNEFTNCKSELKFFEAAIVGTVSIATPIYTYKNAIIDGKNSYLAREDEWDYKIEKLYSEVGSERYAFLAREGYHYVRERYGFDKFSNRIENTLLSTD